MKILIATMGIPGSGKTTEIRKFTTLNAGLTGVVISPDSIREELTGSETDQSKNSEVFDTAHRRLRKALLEKDVMVIFDATNVKQFARQNLLDIANDMGAEPRLWVFHTSYEDCCYRNSHRERVVPDHAMERMYGEFKKSLEDIRDEPWAEVVNLHNTVAWKV